MHREYIIQQLTAYRSIWKNESAMAQRFIDFITANPDCFNRELKTGHVTGSAWVVNQAGSHVLLTHHKKLDKWLQLGGHADGDPDILRVARREVQEESGLEMFETLGNQIFDIDAHLIPEHGNEPGHYHFDIRYAMQSGECETYVVSDESHDLNWVRIEDVAQLTEEESMLRMARKWKKQRARTSDL